MLHLHRRLLVNTLLHIHLQWTQLNNKEITAITSWQLWSVKVRATVPWQYFCDNTMILWQWSVREKGEKYIRWEEMLKGFMWAISSKQRRKVGESRSSFSRGWVEVKWIFRLWYKMCIGCESPQILSCCLTMLHLKILRSWVCTWVTYRLHGPEFVNTNGWQSKNQHKSHVLYTSLEVGTNPPIQQACEVYAMIG